VNKAGPRIFGFAEFISALALLVIVFTVVDFRYKFRLQVAPTPLFRVTFGVIGAIGILTLLTEVWVAQDWLVVRTAFITTTIWQATLGGIFLASFLTWIWYAFVRPSSFGRRNAKRYAHSIFATMVKGDDNELAILANEVARSAGMILKMSSERPGNNIPSLEVAANQTLASIGNQRFCKILIERAPTTIIELFRLARIQNRDFPLLGYLAVNISTEAITNENSVLHYEMKRFDRGILAQFKPFSSELYGNYRLIESLTPQSPLDVDYFIQREWRAPQWNVYFFSVLVTLRSYLAGHQNSHSSSLLGAFEAVNHAIADLQEIDDLEAYFKSDQYNRFDAAINFIEGAVKEIEEAAHAPLQRRAPPAQRRRFDDIYEVVAEAAYKIILKTSQLKRKDFGAWAIQRNSAWEHVFGDVKNKSAGWKVVQLRVRRKIYEELITLNNLPHWQNTRLLGLVLNCTSIAPIARNLVSEEWPLVLFCQAWARKNFAQLHFEHQELAENILVGRLSYDELRGELIQTYERGLKRGPNISIAAVEPADKTIKKFNY
jgi:hypothetical protein